MKMVKKITLSYKSDTWEAKDNFDYSVFADYGNDKVTTKGGNDFLYGFDGNDKLYGGAGNDYLHGGLGQDFMDGGLGDDIYVVNEENDGVYEYLASNGIDTVQTTLAKYTLVDIAENLDLLAGGNWGIGNGFANKINGNDDNNKLEGKGGNDTIDGKSGSDTIYGGEGDDNLNGGAGTDYLYGDAGKDELYGGFGDDTLHGGKGGDKLYGSVGTDTASYTGSAAGVQVFLNTGGTSGGDAIGDKLFAIENLTGSDHNDWLTGDGKANVLRGGDGNDHLMGMEGNDAVVGGAGADKLEGNAGDDHLNGGAGADEYWGSVGKDTFIFTGKHGLDTIFDFEDGLDKIEVSAADFAGMKFVDSNNDTIIMQDGLDSIIWVKNIDAAQLTQADFLLV